MTSEVDRGRLLGIAQAHEISPGDVILFYSDGEDIALCLATQACECRELLYDPLKAHTKWLFFARDRLYEEHVLNDMIVTKLK